MPGASISPGNSGLALVATTGPAGFPLQDATPNILTWTAPNDGGLHPVKVFVMGDVTVATTGGQIWTAGTMPDGTGFSFEHDIGSHAGTGYTNPSAKDFLVKAGTQIAVYQATAVSVGACTYWAQLWAS